MEIASNPSQGLFSFSGIASGLDTDNMIEQLLKVERAPIRRIEQQQETLKTEDEAWVEIKSKLSSLRSATDGLTRFSDFQDMMSVTSSNEDAVSVTSTGPSDGGSHSFTVSQLATRQQHTSADAFASTDATLDGRELQVTMADGTIHDFTADLGAGATLDDLVTAINDADVGVEAQTLQVSSGQHQLVLAASETGQDGAFQITGEAGWNSAFTETQAAQDAQLDVGGITVTRSSNTIDDLVDGAEITLHQATTSDVTVSAERDIDGAVTAVVDYVKALNGAIDKISALTDYDAESDEAAPLQGDSSARQLLDLLRRPLTRPIPGQEGMDSLVSSLGMELDRDGRVQFDEAQLREQFEGDFLGTASRLTRSLDAGAQSDHVSFASATETAQPGTYSVEITQAAARMQATATSAWTAPAAGESLTMTLADGDGDGDTVDVTLDDTHATAQDAADAINAALDDAGWGSFDAGVDGNKLTLSSAGYGSGNELTVSTTGTATTLEANVAGLVGTHDGVDVAGTVGGEAATGNGRILTSDAGDAEGLSIQVQSGVAVDTAFDVSFSRGLMGELSTALDRVEGSTGIIARARDAIDRDMQLHDDRIESYERRIASRERTLIREFTAMETAMSRHQQQQQRMMQQLSGMQ